MNSTLKPNMVKHMKKKPSNDFVGHTPDGARTTDLQEYLDSWRALTEPLKEKLGVSIIGFNPGMLVRDAKGESNACADLPVWLVKRIVGALNTKPVSLS